MRAGGEPKSEERGEKKTDWRGKQRETEIEWGKNKEGKGRKRENIGERKKGEREGMENTLHYNSLLLQLCYLHSNNRGLASAEQLLINNTTGERGGS